MSTHELTKSLADIGDRADGVTTRAQLLALRFSSDQIKAAIARTLLVPALPGVYLVARHQLTARSLRQVALAYAAPAMLAGTCAGEQYGWFPLRPGVAIVNTTRSRRARTLRTAVPMQDGAAGLIRLRPSTIVDARMVGGLPTAQVPRALIDIAGAERPERLKRAWSQADYGNVLDLLAVDLELRATRRPGAPLVRALLEAHPGRDAQGDEHYNSPSEVDFRQLIADAGLPAPEVNVPLWVAGRWYIADFFWPDLNLILELDDPSHDRPLARQRDAARDQDLSIAGFDVTHFRTDDVRRSPRSQLERLAHIIQRQRERHAVH